MTMLEGLSKPMRDALDAIRANKSFAAARVHSQTLKALTEWGLITHDGKYQNWQLSPVGEMAYFSDEVMATYTTDNFEVGQDVEFLHWHTNGSPWRFEWEAGWVQRITKAFVFVKYPDGKIKKHMPKRLRRKPMPTLSAVVAEALIEAAALQPTTERDFYAEMSGVVQEVHLPAEMAATDHAQYEALAATDPYERFIIGDRAVRKADNAEIIISAVDGDYISGSGTRYCEKTVGMIRSGNGTYIKAKDYVHVPVTVTRAHRKHFMRPVNFESRPVVTLTDAVQSAGQSLGLSSTGFNAFDVLASVLLEARALMQPEPTDTSFEPYIPEPRTEGDRIIVTGFCSVCGCQYEESWPNTMNRERWWRWTNMISRCSVCFRNNCYECGKPLPATDEKRDVGYCADCAHTPTDTNFEPLIPDPRFVAPGLVAVTAVCNLCGCQYDSIHLATLRNPWLFANQNPRCPACLWPDVEARKRQRDQAALEHAEPLAKEPRMVNERLIAVTAFCKACGGQYDDISYYEIDNPWMRSHLVDYCPICLQFSCMWCGKELPAPAEDVICERCFHGEPPMQVTKAQDTLPASVLSEFSLLGLFLDGGEGAYHELWTWYMERISIGLIAYESADVLQAQVYERAMRSAASLLHNRFEEEYFNLVCVVGTGRPDADLLYHRLPISVETTVRDWLFTWGGFDYVAQMIDQRHISRDHVVYVDPIKPTLSPAEYREGQYGNRQRAGVCRVWWHAPSQRRLVERVTQDDETGRWYVHAHKLVTPIPLIPDEYFTVEELEPVRINDRVQRIDNEQIGMVIGISGGDVWVKPEQGGEQPRWKRIHVDVIRDPQDDPTDEYDRALNEAVLETMGGAHAGAPQPWTPDLLKRARISTGVHAGVIGQVTDIGSNSRGETFKVFGEWYNASDLEDPNTPMLDPEVIARNCAMIRLRLHGGLRVGRIKSVTHVEDQYYRVVFTHFTEYVPDEIYERVRFAYEAAHASDTPELSIFVDLAHPPFWRVRQSDEAREFQALLDAAGIALEARFNAQHELLVYHPLADVLERLCANVRKLAGVLAVDLGFNDNACLALVKRLEGVAVNG